MAATTIPSGDAKLPVCVIGGGYGGVSAVKQCLDDGLEVEAFELRSEIGGIWAYQPESSATKNSGEFVETPMYDGCIINSCRDTTAFSDFPLDPARYQPYFGHTRMLEYMKEYAAHFDVTRHIRLNTQVLSCEPHEDGTWTVRVQTLPDGPVEEKLFGAVLVSTGHLHSPIMPDLKNQNAFKGQLIHSHKYRNPGPFLGKRVAIIGFGASAVDMACELGPLAEEVHVITRRGGWVVPRYILGKPVEAFDNRATQAWVPPNISQWLQTQLLYLVQGKTPKGLEADHKILEQNPTVHSTWWERVTNGQVIIQRASVDELTETGLALSNGVNLDVDVIICATGYSHTYYPFLPNDVLQVSGSEAPEDDLDLYKLIIPPSPKYKNLFFLGVADAVGSYPVLVEAQSRYVSAIINGIVRLPSYEDMMKDIKSRRAHRDKIFVHSPRHYVAVHPIPYIDDLLKPLGASPTFGRMLAGIFTSGHPWKAYKIMNATYFSVISASQWRLYGHGNKKELAEATLLRTASEKSELHNIEVKYLHKGTV